jgi:hypothetical protein
MKWLGEKIKLKNSEQILAITALFAVWCKKLRWNFQGGECIGYCLLAHDAV